MEILQPVPLPLLSDQSGLGLSLAVSAPRGGFCWDPGFSHCQHPWQSDRLGLPRPSFRARMPEASLGLSPSCVTPFGLDIRVLWPDQTKLHLSWDWQGLTDLICTMGWSA